MGSFSLQAEATSPTLVHVFIKATTTPSPCFPSQRGCAGLCGRSQGPWGALLSPPVPGEGDAPCPSAAGTPWMCNINQSWVPCPLPAHSSPVCPGLSAVTWAEPAQQSCRVSPRAACHQLLLPGDDAFSRHVSFLCLWYFLDKNLFFLYHI